MTTGQPLLRRYVLMLDLKDDAELIAEYESFHRSGGVWPGVLESIREAGVAQMSIYRCGPRMVMVMEVDERFSFERKALADTANPLVQSWEQLMWKFQQPLPDAPMGEKWCLAEPIFDLAEHPRL